MRSKPFESSLQWHKPPAPLEQVCPPPETGDALLINFDYRGLLFLISGDPHSFSEAKRAEMEELLAVLDAAKQQVRKILKCPP